MKPLHNSRHEKFAQGVAAGEPASRVYARIYGVRGKSAEESASRLSRNVKVAARVAEIRQAVEGDALAQTLLTIRAKREFLAAVVRAAPGDLDESSPLVQSFKLTEHGREIRLCDKLRAIELDAKLAGEFAAEKVEVKGDGLLELLQAIRGGV